MENNNVEVIINNYVFRSPVDRRRVKDRRSFFKLQTRSPVDRRRVKDSLSFFKLQTRSHVDKRRVKYRRSFLKQEGLAHNPERRANMIGRRMIGDRMGMLSRYYKYFVGKSALIFKRKLFAK
jgi:hypothetical protein